jgi:hypothetical protein
LDDKENGLQESEEPFPCAGSTSNRLISQPTNDKPKITRMEIRNAQDNLVPGLLEELDEEGINNETEPDVLSIPVNVMQPIIMQYLLLPIEEDAAIEECYKAS